MRTTLTIDDNIGRQLKELAHRQGKSFKQVVNEVLRRGLVGSVQEVRGTYTIEPSALGARADVDLIKAMQLAGDLEDEELARKLSMRK